MCSFLLALSLSTVCVHILLIPFFLILLCTLSCSISVSLLCYSTVQKATCKPVFAVQPGFHIDVNDVSSCCLALISSSPPLFVIRKKSTTSGRAVVQPSRSLSLYFSAAPAFSADVNRQSTAWSRPELKNPRDSFVLLRHTSQREGIWIFNIYVCVHWGTDRTVR